MSRRRAPQALRVLDLLQAMSVPAHSAWHLGLPICGASAYAFLIRV
jgi:hypothetical protein